MIARLWFGTSSLNKAKDYIKHFKTTVFPELDLIDGFQRAYILKKDTKESIEFAILTIWESMESIRQFTGDRPESAVVPDEAEALLSKFDPIVQHFDIIHVLGKVD